MQCHGIPAGEKLSESTAADVRELCNTLLSAYLTQLLETGFLHADPHPGAWLLCGSLVGRAPCADMLAHVEQWSESLAVLGYKPVLVVGSVLAGVWCPCRLLPLRSIPGSTAKGCVSQQGISQQGSYNCLLSMDALPAGNLLRTPDGKIAILDYGLMTTVPPDYSLALVEYIAHLSGTGRGF